MRLFRHLFILLMLLSMAILPSQASIMSRASEGGHELHAQHAHMHAQYAEIGSLKDARASIQASTQSEHHEHCALDHGGNCCLTCGAAFMPADANLRFGLLSHSAALPIVGTDARRNGAFPGVTLRPPISG